MMPWWIIATLAVCAVLGAFALLNLRRAMRETGDKSPFPRWGRDHRDDRGERRQELLLRGKVVAVLSQTPECGLATFARVDAGGDGAHHSWESAFPSWEAAKAAVDGMCIRA